MRKPNMVGAALFLVSAGAPFLSAQTQSPTPAAPGSVASTQSPCSGTANKADAKSAGTTGDSTKDKAKSSQDCPPLPSAPDPHVAQTPATLPPAPDPGVNQTPTTSAAPDSSASQAPATQPAPKKKTEEDNPFPEDVSRSAAAAARQEAVPSSPNAPVPNLPPPPNPQQGSSSRDGLDKLGIDDESRRQLKVQSPDGSAGEYDPKRATEDVRVARFYLQTGNFKGAYERLKDATVFDHENVEAVYWLAEAARKINLPQEAVQNYRVYLEANPDGQNAKAAKKALSELASSVKP